MMQLDKSSNCVSVKEVLQDMKISILCKKKTTNMFTTLIWLGREKSMQRIYMVTACKGMPLCVEYLGLLECSLVEFGNLSRNRALMPYNNEVVECRQILSIGMVQTHHITTFSKSQLMSSYALLKTLTLQLCLFLQQKTKTSKENH